MFCQTEVPIGSNKNKDDLIRYAFDLPSVKRAILSSESAASDDSGATANEETERADNDDDFGLMSGYDDDIGATTPLRHFSQSSYMATKWQGCTDRE